MAKNYIIYAPLYSKSNGVRVLYKLAELINSQGFNAYVFARPSKDVDCKFINKITDKMRSEDIVIYPEIVSGNPLQFKNVVRYILYFSGKLGGDEKYFDNELLFTFSKQYMENCPELAIPTLDTKLFYKDDTLKTIDSYFVYKGGKWKDIPEFAGMVEINSRYPETRQELAELLRKTKTLYSYDRHSILLEEASLCGCDVKLITKDGFEDYSCNYFEEYKNLDEQLAYFIGATQEMDNKGKIQPLTLKQKIKFKFYYLKHLYYKFIQKKYDKAKIYLYKHRGMM